ncbi:translation initiation inhibitor [Helicobacter cinaedi PAGU611]|uniref:Endoribonuclease L-PSP n=1 Tax=Helicobacter cinaedi CCUG 18818 = ATCC BAA-847 TaxID=537971 RepID=A0AAI8QFZ6_9HELI|nr:RidA family protein [Helicobacter cinaedi]AWK61886.1 RidA family protein [Helicobacter cinaedi]EFR46664.1 putative endoribonuclease L-PSP [Helicobacter cinaedi CCUG 18818 = ATCC BAA-847]QOQ91786.1 RidA family protein [Helicobacter cinaedi]QOQ95988.1 RidA family protein [Helicobacter cinaedi]BAM12314.1 translation initiation inhibitor [Helicobacter cinaedi PAGU611]
MENTQPISTLNAPQAIGPYSQAYIYNGVIYTSGQIALTPQGEFIDGDITAQSTQVLNNLKAILESAGSSLQKVIKTSVFLSDMEHFNALNAVYAEFFGSHKPARSTIAVKTLPKNALVEIECIAVL